MLGEIGAGLGAYGGSQLGQALNMPRNLAWQGVAGGAKGLADILNQMTGSNLDFGSGEAYGSGADLVAGMLGMDPNDPLTQGLGMGAEMLGDPLTYAGGLLGKGAGALVGSGIDAVKGARAASAAAKAEDAASLATRLERMAGDGLGADVLRPAGQAVSLDDQVASQAQKSLMGTNLTRDPAPYLNDVQPLRQVVSPESMATGATRTYPKTDPMLAGQMEGMGLGQAAGDTMGGVPIPFEMQAGLHPNMNHADKFGAPGVPPSFAATTKGRPKAGAATLVPRQLEGPPPGWGGGTEAWAKPQAAPLPNITPDDVAVLRQQSQMIGPDALSNIHMAGQDPFKGLANSRYVNETSSLADMLRATAEDADFGLKLGGPGTPFPPTPQIPGVGPDFMDKYGPYLAAGVLGGGVGSAYAMGQNR